MSSILAKHAIYFSPLSCPPSGVADISPCQHGSPSAASLPHFLFGDPVLFERIRGLTPNPKLHEFYMDIEPVSWMTLLRSIKINLIIFYPTDAWSRDNR